MKGLTKRQRDIVNFIQSFIKENQYSPSYREIQQHFNFSSLGTVYKHIQVLKRKGFISSDKQSSRSMTLTNDAEPKDSGSAMDLPFIGLVKVGSPIETFPKMQSLAIPNFLVHTPEKTYVLKVHGDFLSEEMICNGDFMIVEARQEAHPGEIILGLVNNHDTIVKRYYQDGEYVRLEGCSPHHQPIILKPNNIQIQGVVVGLLRLFN